MDLELMDSSRNQVVYVWVVAECLEALLEDTKVMD